MDNKISREFHFGSLLRFSLPTIAMMLMMSLYSMVDGIFVSQFVGTNAFSSINIIIPVTFAVLGVGIMLGTGGSAVIARKLGEKKEKEARQDFSLLMLFGVVLSVVLALLGLLFRDPLIRILGANDTLMADCRVYFTILAAGFPAYMLQIMFQSYFVTAGRPHLGLWATVGAGLLNAVLDYLFNVPLGMGVAGAALATVAGYCVPAVIGLNFFFRRKGNLYFVRPVRNRGTLLRSCANGSSEMVTNIASSVISILFNLIMIRSYGADGVAAINIVLYGQFLLTAIFLGFSGGVAPVVSYNYGAQNRVQLKRVVRICLIVILGCSVMTLGAALLFAPGLVGIFAGRDTSVYPIALHGFYLFSLSYLFCGLNIYASSLFTALSNGKVSALISFLRTFGFILPVLLALPVFAGADGVWLAVPIAEALCVALSVICLLKGRKRYGYG